MYILPEKFTGLDRKEVGVANFKSLCFSLQGMGLLNVIEIMGYEYPKNYYFASVVDSDEEFDIYMNAFCSVVGFGHITDEHEKYIDKPEIKKAIYNIDPRVEVLSVAELSQSVVAKSKEKLSGNELKDLNYWLPCTVGRVLFSWYFD